MVYLGRSTCHAIRSRVDKSTAFLFVLLAEEGLTDFFLQGFFTHEEAQLPFRVGL